MHRSISLLALAFYAAVSAPAQQHAAADGAQQTLGVLSAQYFAEVYYHYSPSQGTAAGLHQYDSEIENLSAANVAKETTDLHTWQKKFESIPADGLDAEPRADLSMLLGNLRYALLQLEQIRPWQKNPDTCQRCDQRHLRAHGAALRPCKYAPASGYRA